MYIRFTHLAVSALFCSLLSTNVCLGQTTELISVDSLGVQANSLSWASSISASGRYVAFDSYASNLVPADTNGTWDVFVHDRQTGVTEIISVDSRGTQGDFSSQYPSISADGRYVAFGSSATNLVPGNTNAMGDVFVHDRQTGVTECVSIDSLGLQANNSSVFPAISAEGRYVAFQSYASNLVPLDTNLEADIFVHDRQTGVTERVSINSLGAQANSWSMWPPSISADGRYVAFNSLASNFVPGDTNMAMDVFVHNRQTGVTECVSVDSLGTQGNDESMAPSISADGRYVMFHSDATDLVDGDTNGRTDVFAHDRQTGVTERVSIDSLGTQGNGLSAGSSISADGNHVAFYSYASNLVPRDINSAVDAFVHDLRTGVTERVSVNALGTQGYGTSFAPSISADGSYVAFNSDASNLVSRDVNGLSDIFVHDRWNGLGENSIYLDGPTISPVLSPLDLTWQTTRGNSQYWLSYSMNINGAVLGGHNFDIGAPVTVLASGTNAANGVGSFTLPLVPGGLVGLTLHFEVAARDGAGVLFDSNLHSVTFH